MSPAADPATAGGEPEGTQEDAIDQRRLRRIKGAHTNPTLRKTAVKSGHTQAGHRVHQLPE